MGVYRTSSINGVFAVGVGECVAYNNIAEIPSIASEPFFPGLYFEAIMYVRMYQTCVYTILYS